MRRAQMPIQKRQQRVDFGAQPRIAVERIDACQSQQDERVIIGIAQRIQNAAVRRQRVNKTRTAIGPFAFASR